MSRREAIAAVLEEEHHLLRVRLAHPEAELRAIGALTFAPGHDLLPSGGVGGSTVVVRGSRVVVTATVAIDDESHTPSQQHHDGDPRRGEASPAKDPTTTRRPALAPELAAVIVFAGQARLPLRPVSDRRVMLLAAPILVGTTRLTPCLIHAGDTAHSALRRT
jgi:hypothetical protein